MTTPGSNLLLSALKVIQRQALQYFKAQPRTLNQVGQDVVMYDAPIQVFGSFQPVPKSMYEQYGLDFTKDYFIFYSLNDITDVHRDVSGDQIEYNGRRFQCESNTEWFSLDYWKAILCIRVPNPPAIEEQAVLGFNELPQVNSNANFDNGSFADVG
jgi:hypothetical protein